jgi:hypothetical protein
MAIQATREAMYKYSCPNNEVNGIMEYMFSLQNCTIYSIVVIYRPV